MYLSVQVLAYMYNFVQVKEDALRERAHLLDYRWVSFIPTNTYLFLWRQEAGKRIKKKENAYSDF